MMKKNMMKLALVAMVITALATPVNAKIYYRVARITKIRREQITCRDSYGFGWKFRGTGFRKNENLILVMDDNHTRRIKDDMVVDVIRLEVR